MTDIALFDVSGRMLRVGAGAWETALNAARANGWKPAGTGAPPRALMGARETAWDGRYVEPMGQYTGAADAARFAQALAKAVVRGGGDQGMAELASFAARGSFIICAQEDSLEALGRSISHGWTRMDTDEKTWLGGCRK
jgi:hypothetical protein